MTGPCPDENALVRFSGGKLSGADLGAIEQHLDGCSACRTLIAQLASLHSKTLETPHSGATAVPALQGKVGRYHVERLVGGGGMGMVYAGRDRELNRVVAIKVLKTGGNEEARARLLREAQTMAKLSHPNLVPIFELGTERGDDFLAMELIDGPTLDFWLREKKRSWQEVVAKFIEAGRGLEAAHAAGVVHRDFKPANVLIGPDGRARVTDFGLARPRVPELGADADGASIELTREGSLLGTPAYMSPEQLDGQVADVRSDQFSFCVALVEALVGHRPFAGRTPGELRAAMKAGKAPDVDLQPARLKKALLKGMAVSPEARFASMSALLAELQALLQPVRLKPAPMVLAVLGLVVLAAVAALATKQAPAPAAEPMAAARPPLFDEPKTKVLELTVGQIQTIAVPGVQRVQTGKPEIASVRIIGNQQVEVTGVAPGQFFLLLETRAGPHEPIKVVSVAIGVSHHGNRNFTMGVGEVRTLDVPGLTHIEAPDPEVLNARITGKAQVTVEGITGGRSLLKTFVQGSPHPLEWMIEVKVPQKPSLTEGEPIALSPGVQKVITVPNVQRVAIGDAAITDVKTIGNSQLLLIGGDEGQTTLLIWKSDGSRESHVVTVKGTRRPPVKAEPETPLPDAVPLTGQTTIGVGGQKLFRVAGMQRVAVGDAAIADVKTVGNDRLLVLGMGEGRTTLLIWKANGERTSALVSVVGAGEREGDELYSLVEGEQQRVAVKGVERAEAQPAGIVAVKAEGREAVVLTGLKAGKARVEAVMADGAKRTMDVQVQAGEVAREELALSVGEHRLVDLQSVQRVAVADPAVLEVQVVGKQLMLFGKGKGTTTLKAWGAQGARREWDVSVSPR